MGFEDELKKWESEKPSKAARPVQEFKTVDDLPDLDPIATEPEPAAPVVPAVPSYAPSRPTTDYSTTIATSPEHATQLKAKADREKVEDAAFLPALGYGLARSATLGGVDRLVGFGTAIGEKLGASEDTAPVRPGAYQEGRSDYLTGEDKARTLSPGGHLLGEFAGGAPIAVVAPQSLAGRLAFSGGLGATAGALNTRQDDAKEIVKNAAKGAAAGVAVEGTVGTLARRAIRGAPKREIDNTVRDVMESEAGRATATTGKKLARDIDDIRDVLKQNPDARAAVRGEAKEAIPVITAKADVAYAGQPARYAVIDQTIKPITVTQLLGKIVAAEKDVPENRLPLVKKGLKALRDSLRDDFAPKWSGQASWTGQRQEITTEQLRKWVSSVQGTAEAAMGGINGTNAAKVPADIAKIANKILEERLDEAATKGGAGVAKTVSEIRESDRQVSAWLGIKRALDDRQVKELAQNAGLNSRLNQSNATNANAAGAALAMSGHPLAGATVAARGVISKAANSAGRSINDRILVPIQEAAQRGATWAEVLRVGAEAGAPQSLTRAIFEKYQKREPIPTPQVPQMIQSVQPARMEPAIMNQASPRTAPPTTPAPSPTPGNMWPRDYATSTRTQ